MIEFSCPNCGRPMRVQDDAAGKTGRCKNCGTSLAAPVPKRIFEEPRFWIAAVGGLAAIQGIIFTIIDAGLFSVSVTMLGFAIAAGGLHVEVRAMLKRVSGNLPAYRARIKEAFERFYGKAGAVLLWMSTNISRCAGRINETTKERIQQFKQQQAHRAAIRELKKQQARDSMKPSEAPTECANEMPLPATAPMTQQQTAEDREFEACVTENRPADMPTQLDAQAFSVPELSPQGGADPFTDLVETQATQTTPSDLPLAADVPPSPPSVVAVLPQRVQCPYCGELIVADAIKCRFCNEYLDDRSVALWQSAMQVNQGRVTHNPSESIEEYEVWRGHPYRLRHNLIPLLFCCLLIPVYGVGLILLLYWLGLSSSKTLIVTNRRTILQLNNGQTTQEIRHEDVRFLEVTKSSLVNGGTIVISTAAKRGELEIPGIYDPHTVKELIDGYRYGDGRTASLPSSAKQFRSGRSSGTSVTTATGCGCLLVLLGLLLIPAMQQAREAARQSEKADANRQGIGENAKKPADAQVPAEAQIPADVTFTIIKSHVIPNRKRGVDVRLNKKVSEDVLAAIARKIKEDDRREFTWTYIIFLLPGMEIDAGAWATADFHPTLKIQILGSTSDEESKVTTKLKTQNRQIIGQWTSERFGWRYVIFRESGRLKFEIVGKEGGSIKQENVAEKKSNIGRRFDPVPPDSDGEHWIIDSSGNLQIFDSMGHIETLPKAAP